MIVSLFLIEYITNNNKKQERSIAVEMIVSDKFDSPIISYATDSSSVDVLFDLVYSSDFETDGKLILLKNFQPVSFTVNGGTKVDEYNFTIVKTSEEMISENNVISIDSLDANLNDMCILLFVQNNIFTCRFQIENTSIKEPKMVDFKTTYNVNIGFGEKARFYSSIDKIGSDEGVMVNLKDSCERFYCAIDLEKILEDTSMIELYKKRKKEISKYAIVPILNNQSIGDVFYCESSESRFSFEISTAEFSSYNSIKFIIFPYPNEFENSYLKTYKAFLWSDPYITYTLYKEEIE